MPANWQHPKNERGYYIPLSGGSYAEDVEEWGKLKTHWDQGFVEGFVQGNIVWINKDDDPDAQGKTFEEYHYTRPTEAEYMPDWSDIERTHWMMYESVSEGTPISPAFATPQELCRWLVKTGASAFADQTASYDAWWAVCQEGSTPGSAVLDVTTGQWTSAAEMMVRE